MKPVHLWSAAILIAVAVLVHAVFPRYDVRFAGGQAVRVDRWTGSIAAPDVTKTRAQEETSRQASQRAETEGERESLRTRLVAGWRRFRSGQPERDELALFLLDRCQADLTAAASNRHKPPYLDDNRGALSTSRTP